MRPQSFQSSGQRIIAAGHDSLKFAFTTLYLTRLPTGALRYVGHSELAIPGVACVLFCSVLMLCHSNIRQINQKQYKCNIMLGGWQESPQARIYHTAAVISKACDPVPFRKSHYCEQVWLK